MRLDTEFTDSLAAVTRLAKHRTASHVKSSHKRGSDYSHAPRIFVDLKIVDEYGICLQIECFKGDYKHSCCMWPLPTVNDMDTAMQFIIRSIQNMGERSIQLSIEAVEFQDTK